MSTFSEPTRDQLKHYVYRLIDPRSGETFYVGRGQNDRVFNHVRRAARLTPNHEDDDLRMDRISKIRRNFIDAQLTQLTELVVQSA